MYTAILPIADITPDFTSLDSEHQFIRLLSYFNGEYEYCQIVCKYVYDCFSYLLTRKVFKKKNILAVYFL